MLDGKGAENLSIPLRETKHGAGRRPAGRWGHVNVWWDTSHAGSEACMKDELEKRTNDEKKNVMETSNPYLICVEPRTSASREKNWVNGGLGCKTVRGKKKLNRRDRKM